MKEKVWASVLHGDSPFLSPAIVSGGKEGADRPVGLSGRCGGGWWEGHCSVGRMASFYGDKASEYVGLLSMTLVQTVGVKQTGEWFCELKFTELQNTSWVHS